MRAQAPVRDHVFLHNKLTGAYVDAGEATTVDRVLSFFSAGSVRIAPPRVDVASDGFESNNDSAKASRLLGNA